MDRACGATRGTPTTSARPAPGGGWPARGEQRPDGGRPARAGRSSPSSCSRSAASRLLEKSPDEDQAEVRRLHRHHERVRPDAPRRRPRSRYDAVRAGRRADRLRPQLRARGPGGQRPGRATSCAAPSRTRGCEPRTSRPSTSATPSGCSSTARATSAACRRRSSPALRGVPAMRHEAACASGGLALLAATAEIEAGRYDVRAGPRRRAGEVRPRRRGGAHPRRGVLGRPRGRPSPTSGRTSSTCSRSEYDERYGLDDAAPRPGSPSSTTATPAATPTPRPAPGTSRSSAPTTTPTRSSQGACGVRDCSRSPTAAAGVVVAGRRSPSGGPRGTAWTWRPSRGCSGWGHRTCGLAYAAQGRAVEGDPTSCRTSGRPITDAFRRAGVADVFAARRHRDPRLLHARASTSRIDHFGITAPGESWKAVESGTLERDGELPVNPSGGLIGGGHPVGATGVRMVARRDEAGHRHRRRLPGRGRAHLRHPQHRWLDDDHRLLRDRGLT